MRKYAKRWESVPNWAKSWESLLNFEKISEYENVWEYLLIATEWKEPKFEALRLPIFLGVCVYKSLS